LIRKYSFNTPLTLWYDYNRGHIMRAKAHHFVARDNP
jgi:hypothetical protein